MPEEDDRFRDVDYLMDEIRQALSWTAEAREVNELQALQLLLDLTRKIHSIQDIQELITLILDSAITFVDADRAFLVMLEGDGALRFKMGRSRHKEYLSAEMFTPSTGVIERTLEKGRTLLVPDAQADSVLSKRRSVQDLNLRTVVCTPLMVKKNPIGLLYVDCQHSLGSYSAAHLNVFASLADQAAVAIKNAQKFETRT
ncbi:MAG: GAF domain-containing protein [Chloroflexi bacterium]|nr:GAF domain-containing protein [Chloroflexota bacterium]